jgi:hypothetical protein
MKYEAFEKILQNKALRSTLFPFNYRRNVHAEVFSFLSTDMP